jgi:hypothetical protein
MFYVIHDNTSRGERLTQLLRDSGYSVSDVRADDSSVPDSALAGDLWTAAQVTMKLCDMVSVFQTNDVFVLPDSENINRIVLQDLNNHYQLGVITYCFMVNEFVDCKSMIPYNIDELEQKLEK